MKFRIGPICTAITMSMLLTTIGCSKDGNGSKNSGPVTTKNLDDSMDFNALSEIKIVLKSDTEELLKKKSELLNTGEEFDQAISELTNTLSTLNASIDKSEEEKIALADEIKSIEKQVTNLEDEAKTLRQKIFALGPDANTETTNESITPTLDRQLTIAKMALQRLAKEVSINEKESKMILEQINFIVKQKESLSFPDSILESVMGKYDKQILELQTKINLVNDEKSVLDHKKENMISKIEEKKSKIEGALQKAKESKDKKILELSISLEKINDQINPLSEKINSLTSKTETITEEIVASKKDATLRYAELNELKLKKENNTKTTPLTDSAAYKKLDLIKKMSEGTIETQDIAKSIISIHNESKKTDNENEDSINNADMIAKFAALSDRSATQEIQDFKLSYEVNLSSDHNGDELIYNRDYVSVTDPINENRMQCYSGTMLFNVLNELSAHPHANTVVILTNGHIQAGYIAKEEGKKILYGIESTAGGKAIVNYGETKNVTGDIRVFDAKQFMLVELFKNEISNFKEVYGQMLKSIERYGFVTTSLKALDDADKPSTKSNGSPQLNSTPFAFGSSNQQSGDIQRATFDSQENMEFRIIILTNNEEEMYPEEEKRHIEEEYFYEFASCKGIKTQIGSLIFSASENGCLAENNIIVNLSSYTPTPIINTASLEYTNHNQEKRAALAYDNYNNHSACNITTIVEPGSREKSVSINLKNIDKNLNGLYHNQELPLFPYFTEGEIKTLNQIYLNTKDSELFSAFEKMKHGEGHVSTKIKLLENDSFFVNLNGKKSHVSKENECTIELSDRKLLGTVRQIVYGFNVQGVQIEITCPKIRFDDSDTQMSDVKLTVNCGIAETTQFK